jgi:hypothetical protein
MITGWAWKEFKLKRKGIRGAAAGSCSLAIVLSPLEYDNDRIRSRNSIKRKTFRVQGGKMGPGGGFPWRMTVVRSPMFRIS